MTSPNVAPICVWQSFGRKTEAHAKASTNHAQWKTSLSGWANKWTLKPSAWNKSEVQIHTNHAQKRLGAVGRFQYKRCHNCFFFAFCDGRSHAFLGCFARSQVAQIVSYALLTTPLSDALKMPYNLTGCHLSFHAMAQGRWLAGLESQKKISTSYVALCKNIELELELSKRPAFQSFNS